MTVSDREDRHNEHWDVIAQLPDYAVGALDDAEFDPIAGHLETCPDCRRELRSIVAIIGALDEAPPLSRAPRERLLASARAALPSAPSETAPAPSAAMAEPIARREPTPIARQPAWWQRRAPAMLATAAVLLIVALGLWNLRLQHVVDDEAMIPRLIANSSIHPLTDGQLVQSATGVVFVNAAENQALLSVDGLPSLEDDRRYQVWLFDERGERTSAGLFAADNSGRVEVVIDPPRPIAGYSAVAISAEPAAGSAAPTSALVLGGWLR